MKKLFISTLFLLGLVSFSFAQTSKKSKLRSNAESTKNAATDAQKMQKLKTMQEQNAKIKNATSETNVVNPTNTKK